MNNSDLAKALSIICPNSGWTVKNGEIVDWRAERDKPTEAELSDALLYFNEKEELKAEEVKKRSELRSSWDEMPYSFIKGPYREKFESVITLLNLGDIDSAKDLIKYAVPNPLFDDFKIAVFNQVKIDFYEKIEEIYS